MKGWDFEAGKIFKNSKKNQITNLVLCLMAMFGLYQCDPWCIPTQNWLKSGTNDILIQEFHNVTRQYVKDTANITFEDVSKNAFLEPCITNNHLIRRYPG